MTPTDTGSAPTYAPEGEPRTQTALYHLDGTPFGGRHARPAGAAELQPGESVHRPIGRSREDDLVAQVEAWMEAASNANRRALEALARAEEAAARAEDAETRLQIAQGVALRLLRRPKAAALEAAIDHASRAIAGRPHRQLAADLDRQLAAYPDDADTLVVAEPPTPEQIARVVAARRQIGLDHDPLVALADLVIRWIAAERQIDIEERTPSRRITGAALEELDETQIALQRAVTP